MRTLDYPIRIPSNALKDLGKFTGHFWSDTWALESSTRPSTTIWDSSDPGRAMRGKLLQRWMAAGRCLPFRAQDDHAPSACQSTGPAIAKRGYGAVASAARERASADYDAPCRGGPLHGRQPSMNKKKRAEARFLANKPANIICGLSVEVRRALRNQRTAGVDGRFSVLGRQSFRSTGRSSRWYVPWRRYR